MQQDQPGGERRRRFLKVAGAGVAGAVATPFAAGPAAAAPPGPNEPAPSLTDPGWHRGSQRAVTGDGATDDTSAIQRVFDSLGAPDYGVSGGHLTVPPGEYVISRTIEIERFAGTIQGTGVGHTPEVATVPGRGTAFRWAGPAGLPMFRITDSSHLAVRDLRFEGRNVAPPSAALDFHASGRTIAGTNAQLVVEDCHFGSWPWAHAGVDAGRMESGVCFSGINGDNDQFRIGRCAFRGGTWGIRIDNTQSVWGSITDCTFDQLTVGIRTSSSSTLVNPQFNRCDTDLELSSTAALDVFAWQSEHSGRLATIGPYASLRVVGGHCQIDGEHLRPGTPLIAAYPSQRSTVSLTGVRFSWPSSERYPGGIEDLPRRPAIEFGPSEDDRFAAGGVGFLVRVDDCTDLHADQCRLVGTMYAAVPRSRGLVEWYSRTKDGIAQFRNELWHVSAGPGTRATLDPGAWDPPRPGTHD